MSAAPTPTSAPVALRWTAEVPIISPTILTLPATDIPTLSIPPDVQNLIETSSSFASKEPTSSIQHPEERAILIEPVKSDAHATSSTSDDYAAKISARLAAVKRFPIEARYRHQEGHAVISLTIKRNGALQSWRFETKSTVESLDQAVRQMVASAKPFPPFPKTMMVSEATFEVPIDFTLE